MSYIKIYNKSQENINFLTSISKKLKPFLTLVDSKEYPIIIYVIQKKSKNDLSHLDLDNNKILLKYNSQLQSKQDILWVFVHEIFHWICLKNKELKTIVFSDENKFLEKALEKVYPKEKGFDHHDLLPYEVASNVIATILVGTFFKRHFFDKKSKTTMFEIKKIITEEINRKTTK